MKLIIDIDDNVFTRLFDNGIDTSSDDREVIDRAVRNGKPYEERPQGEWIPVSERLPDRLDEVLVTFQIPMPNREPVVYRGVFIGSKFSLDNGDVWNWNDPEIKAWMPLPEAYEEAENE